MQRMPSRIHMDDGEEVFKKDREIFFTE